MKGERDEREEMWGNGGKKEIKGEKGHEEGNERKIGKEDVEMTERNGGKEERG